MSHHVFAWLAGFGWTLMPFAPFRFVRVPGRPRAVRVERSTAGGVLRTLVEVSGDGRTVHTTPESGAAEDVVELIRGRAFPHGTSPAGVVEEMADEWRIESSLLSVSWPQEFALRSVADAPPPFELDGPDKALVWIQGPLLAAHLPPLEQMKSPDQRLVDITMSSGGPLVELSYEHAGLPWRMFHCIVDRFPGAVCVVTGQTPERHRTLVRTAVVELAASLLPAPPEPPNAE